MTFRIKCTITTSKFATLLGRGWRLGLLALLMIVLALVLAEVVLAEVRVEPETRAASLQVGGSGTTNRVAKFTSATTIGDSAVFESGGRVGIGTTSPGGDLEIAKDNGQPALLLTHPDATDPAFDSGPIAALKVAPPPNATTRNFVSGIWVLTNGAAVDKGRGIMVNNIGKSDSIYVQLDGTEGTGFAALSNVANTTGFVSETRNASAIAAVVRQGPGGGTSNVLTAEANVPGSAEMIRFNSNQSGKVGAIFRMPGSGNKAIVVKDSFDNNVLAIDADTGQLLTTGTVGIGTTSPQSKLQVVGNYIQFPTISGAPPPSADCDQTSEAGRMVVRTDGPTNLYVCKGTGWAAAAVGVGGIAELPNIPESYQQAGSSSSDHRLLSVALGGALAVTVVVGGAAWYVRGRRDAARAKG